MIVMLVGTYIVSEMSFTKSSIRSFSKQKGEKTSLRSLFAAQRSGNGIHRLPICAWDLCRRYVSLFAFYLKYRGITKLVTNPRLFVDGLRALAFVTVGLRLWSGCIFLVTDHSIVYSLIGSAMMDSRTPLGIVRSLTVTHVPSNLSHATTNSHTTMKFVIPCLWILAIVALCLLLYKSVQHTRAVKSREFSSFYVFRRHKS